LSRVSIYCGANNVKILDEIRNFITFLVFRKGPYNKLIISPGAVNGKVFIPAKDGIFDQHRASSNQHLYASSKKFDKRTQTRWFEALASLSTSIAKFRRGGMNEVN